MDATESDSVESLLERRLRVLGPGLSLFYDPPLVFTEVDAKRLVEALEKALSSI